MTDNTVLQVTDTEGRPVRVIHECNSGVIFHITPINLATLRSIQLKAADIFPYPDKTQYQIPDPIEVAFVEGQTALAEDNPDYLAACRAVDHERAQWTDRAIFDYAVSCPKYPTHEAMVTAFKPQLEALRKIAVLPEDDYEAVLLHLVLTWNQVGVDNNRDLKPVSSDFSRIIQLAIQTVALTPGEVSTGIRFFRPHVQPDRTREPTR